MNKLAIKVFSLVLILSMLLASNPYQTLIVQAAVPTELFFSEYIEGSSNNKVLEIYNGTGAAVDLTAGGYNVQMYFNGNPVSTLTINLTGTVANGDVLVLANSLANATILAQADLTNGSGWFNGDDAVVLRKSTTTIDVIGQIGFDPGAEWGTGLVSTADNTLRRKSNVSTGDLNGADAFDPAVEWDGFATDTFDGLGTTVDTAPSVASTTPVNGTLNFSANSDLTVNFSEPVIVTGTWYTLACSISGTKASIFSGGPTSFSINPSTDFVGGETCTFTILAANVSDLDTQDPPDQMLLDFVVGFTTLDVCTLPYTSIPAIQGSGAAVALTGTQTTQGVVVGDYEGPSPAQRGFFIQDLSGDGNPATSDGIFVFEGSNANTVSLGDVVRVTGTAGENQGQSQVSVGSIVKCGAGSVTPTNVTFPVASADFLEQYEGMLVRLPQTLVVTEHFQLGRFGQVVMSPERQKQPTNVVAPGAPALALQAANNLNRIIIDDATQIQNPDPILFGRDGNPLSASNTLRGGDSATGIVGVLNFTWAGNSASGNAYRVRPVNALGGGVPDFQPTNPRPASAPALTGRLRATGMNLLNFFNTFDGLPDTVDNCTLGAGGAATDCRGADTQAEFDRQWAKTVTAMIGTQADVIGIMEIENDGYGSTSAIQFLVNQLNAVAGAGTYAFIDADAGTGQGNALGTDAIKVGLIYKPAKVTPVGQTAALNSVEFVNGGDSDPRNRPALVQAFQEVATGSRFVIAVNHLKSKGSGCNIPDAGDGQGGCNGVRLAAANLLTAWLASDPTGTGDPDALIVGDLNSYAKEDPIAAIEGAGYTNLIYKYGGAAAYSYVFDGQWGYLDHALSSASLTPQVTGTADWHINSDEPSVLDYNTDFKSANLINTLYAPDEFRISDHDIVLVDLTLQTYFHYYLPVIRQTYFHYYLPVIRH